MALKNLHFALLKNDTPLPDVVKKAGDYGKQFATIFKKAADNKELTITWDVFDVVNEQAYPSLEDIRNGKYAAIVLTGSKYNAHDNDAWILKLVAFNQKMMTDYVDKVKMVGICFGHQTMLRAAGGVTGKNEAGWEVGWTKIQLNDQGKEIFKTDMDFIRIYQFHQDHVSVVPKGFKTLAFTEGNTPHHITVSENGQCITIQGHPEFEKETIATMIAVRRNTGVLETDYANRCLEILESEPLEMEDVWFIEKVLDFVLEKL